MGGASSKNLVHVLRTRSLPRSRKLLGKMQLEVSPPPLVTLERYSENGGSNPRRERAVQIQVAAPLECGQAS